MPSSYPGGLDSFATDKQDDVDSKTGADRGSSTTVGDHATHHNDLADAVNSVEAELGVNPSGAGYSTVAARFTGIETVVDPDLNTHVNADQTVHGTKLNDVRVTLEAPINVRHEEYGALGDGTTNDYAAFAAAIAALPASGGGVFVPPGNYKLNTGLSWDDKAVNIFGAVSGNDGAAVSGTQITAAAGITALNPKNGPNSRGGRSRIAHLRVKGSDASPGSNHGILMQCNEGTVEDVVVQGFGGYGCVVKSGASPDPELNANLTKLDHVRTVFNESGGFLVEGADSNVAHLSYCDADSNTGFGYLIESGGCLILNPHAAGNTGGNYVDSGAGNTWIVPYSESGTGNTADLSVSTHCIWFDAGIFGPVITEGAGSIIFHLGGMRRRLRITDDRTDGKVWGFTSGDLQAGYFTLSQFDDLITAFDIDPDGARMNLGIPTRHQKPLDLVIQPGDAALGQGPVLFTKDNGAGKMQFCVRWPTGGVAVLATEP